MFYEAFRGNETDDDVVKDEYPSGEWGNQKENSDQKYFRFLMTHI